MTSTCSFQAGRGSVLALSVGDPPRLPRTNHFGFQVATTDEVREARERLQAAGVEEVEWQDDDVTVRVQVLDPDGYRRAVRVGR